jgi:hypothetical protein
MELKEIVRVLGLYPREPVLFVPGDHETTHFVRPVFRCTAEPVLGVSLTSVKF